MRSRGGAAGGARVEIVLPGDRGLVELMRRSIRRPTRRSLDSSRSRPPMASEVARRRREIKRRFLKVLRSQLGYAEGPNNATKYGVWYGLNHQPWCAMFVSWAAAKARVSAIVPRHAYTPAGAAWYKKRGRWGNKPRVGAIAYYDTAGLGRISHVGVVEKVLPDGAWYSLEGNTNAAGSREGRVVRRQRRTMVGKEGGFGYPDYTAQARRELERG